MSPAMALEIGEGRFLWRDETQVTLAALLAGDEDDVRRIAEGDAEDFLRELLADAPLEAGQVQRGPARPVSPSGCYTAPRPPWA